MENVEHTTSEIFKPLFLIEAIKGGYFSGSSMTTPCSSTDKIGKPYPL